MIGECDREGCKGYGDLLLTLDCATTRLCGPCRREFGDSAAARALNDEFTRLQASKDRVLAMITARAAGAELRHKEAVEALIAHRATCKAFVNQWLATPRQAVPAETKETP